MSLLTASNLTKKYGNQTVVDNISFDFAIGKCIALIGPNGAGKTTTLRILAGLLTPDSGSVQFENQKKNDDIRNFIGYLPQYPVFHPWMTGMEYLTFSGQLAKLPKEEAGSRAQALLEKVGIADAADKRIGKYSGGMKQRLGIAQAIIHKPKLLLLDEPVSSLDPLGRREVLHLMEELKQEMTILFSTHILGDADEISDELLLLSNGNIVEAGSLEELRQKYQTSIITLTFDDNIEKYKSSLDKLESVQDSYVERNALKVKPISLASARRDILSAAAAENWPLSSFEVNRASLEDMFMKVVGK